MSAEIKGFEEEHTECRCKLQNGFTFTLFLRYGIMKAEKVRRRDKG